MTKKILITGGAGYIGSHIAELLIKNKYKVFVIDNLSTGYKRLLHKKSKFFKLNINNKAKVTSILNKYKIDSIIHLAGNLIISEGEQNPKKYYKNNVIGTKNLMTAILNTKVKNFLFSSTAAVYKDGIHKVTEKSKVMPKSIYGKTKLKAEKVITNFCKSNKINYGILRYFNIVGSSPSGKIGLINKSDHLFKNFSRQALKKKPVFEIYGTDYPTQDGSCVRDFIHVSDIAEIHLKVLKKINETNKSKILNCGYSKGISVKQVANEFAKQSDRKYKIVNKAKRKGDLVKIIAITKSLNNFINWKPKYNKLDKMVLSSLKWEKKL